MRNMFVNSRHQLYYIFLITLFAGVICGTVGYFVNSLLKENYRIMVDLSPMSDEMKDVLYTELSQLVWMLLGFGSIFVVFVFFLSLYFTHRSAGAMYNFKKTCHEVKNGEIGQRINLRKHDDFKDVAKAFNDMMDELQGNLPDPDPDKKDVA